MNNMLLPGDEVIQTGDIQTLSQIIDWGIIDFDVPTLWNKNKGENINVMVCDTGIVDHEDLKDNIAHDKTISFINGEDYTDKQGHGTSVAGVIAAKDSEFGVVGVAPNSKIIPVKVLSNQGFSNGDSLEKALEYALDIKPDIINMSLGGQHQQSQKFHSLVQELFRLNIPIVCAMGNFGEKYPCYPAEYPETIGVTSYKKNREISDFSSRSSDADFALPGEDILTTSLNNQYSIVRGTSFSAPFLSGLLAIILSDAKKRNLKYTIPQIKELLIKSCDDYGPMGKDTLFGYGIINVNNLNNLISDSF
jgi:subtilisin family serine protease